jgi:hypothetical protein
MKKDRVAGPVGVSGLMVLTVGAQIRLELRSCLGSMIRSERSSHFEWIRLESLTYSSRPLGLVPLSRAGLLSGTVLLFCMEPFSMDEPFLVFEPSCG